MSKYFYRIFTIIDLHFGAMQPCSSGLGMTLEASDFRSVRRLVAYSTLHKSSPYSLENVGKKNNSSLLVALSRSSSKKNTKDHQDRERLNTYD